MVFVRSDQAEWLKERVKDLSGIHVLSLEQAGNSWNWDDRVWSSEMEFSGGIIPHRGIKPAGLTR